MKNKKMSIIAALVAVFLIIGLATAFLTSTTKQPNPQPSPCLLYTSDAADER